MKSDPGDFTLVLDGTTRPHINFKASDIELMRKTVAEHDASKALADLSHEHLNPQPK